MGLQTCPQRPLSTCHPPRHRRRTPHAPQQSSREQNELPQGNGSTSLHLVAEETLAKMHYSLRLFVWTNLDVDSDWLASIGIHRQQQTETPLHTRNNCRSEPYAMAIQSGCADDHWSWLISASAVYARIGSAYCQKHTEEVNHQ